MSAVLIDTSCFVHEIPLRIFRMVCSQLDKSDCWRQFAREIGYENAVIEHIKKSESPAFKLLSSWSDQNHTVSELFMILYRLKEFRSMEILSDLVDTNYHRLIPSKRTASSMSLTSLRAQVNAAAMPYTTHQNSKKSNISSQSLSQSDSFTGNVDPLEIVCKGIPKITCGELKQATHDWDKQNILGSGAFGTVYRGKWKCTEVAIKNINCHGFDKHATTKKRLKQVMIEMRFRNLHRHENILPLYGYSFDGSSACLVYQMMAGGSLDQRLRHKKFPLTEQQRLNIAIGTAKGLHFLHTFHKRATIHGDIKSANILLDGNLNPKIGDLSLACHANGRTISKRLYGTHAYLSDEFLTSLVISTKNDVWAFGVVLFELATSLRAFDERRGALCKLSKFMWESKKTPEQFGHLIKPKTNNKSTQTQHILMQLIEIGFLCTRQQSIDRPEMGIILNSLLEI